MKKYLLASVITVMTLAYTKAEPSDTNVITNDTFWKATSGSYIYSQGGGNFQRHNQIDMTSMIGTPNTGDMTVFTDPDTGKSYLCYSYGKGRSKIYLSEIGVCADGQWHLYTISDVAVAGGMVEVGFYADGPADAWCHIDDVTLVMDTADDDNSETSIAGITSSNVQQTEYFTLSGKRIAAPSQGIFLMRIVMSDGTVVNKKVIQR